MRWSREVPLILLLVLSLPVAGCERAPEPSSADARPLVVASIYPVADLAKSLVGEDARVEVLLPAGASPATFDVTPRQVSDLGRAKLFVMVGAGLDEWVSNLPGAASGSIPVIRLAEGLDLLGNLEPDTEAESGGAASEDEQGHEDDGHDHTHDHADDHSHDAGNPHIWLDPILVRDEVLPKLVDALTSVLPGSAEGIEDRHVLLAASLTALDRELRELLQPLEQRAFIATHSAWTYFALRYDLDEAGVVHVHPGQDPSSRELAHLLDIAREKGLPCIFTEPQLGEAAVQAIATELDLPTCMLDPLGGPEVDGRQDYLGLLRFNAVQLAEGLGGGGR